MLRQGNFACNAPPCAAATRTPLSVSRPYTPIDKGHSARAMASVAEAI